MTTAVAKLIRAILHDNIGINEGMFVENAMAQTFASQNRELFFYSRTSRTDRAETMEVDFLIQNGFKVCPIEAKSSGYRTHASLDRFTAKFARRIGDKYVICRGRYEIDDVICHSTWRIVSDSDIALFDIQLFFDASALGT